MAHEGTGEKLYSLAASIDEDSADIRTMRNICIGIAVGCEAVLGAADVALGASIPWCGYGSGVLFAAIVEVSYRIGVRVNQRTAADITEGARFMEEWDMLLDPTRWDQVYKGPNPDEEGFQNGG